MKRSRTGKSSRSAYRQGPPARVLIALCALVLLTAGMFNFGVIRFNRAAVSRQLEALVIVKQAELKRWRTERLDDTALLVAMLETPPLEGDASRLALLKPLLSRFVGSEEYKRLGFYDREGREIACLPLPGCDEARVVEAMRSGAYDGKAGFLTYLDGSGEAGPRVWLIAPTREIGGPGYAALEIDPKKSLYPILSLWPPASLRGETLLITLDGESASLLRFDELSDPVPLIAKQDEGHSIVVSAKAASKEPGGIALTRGFRDAPAIGWVFPVDASPWSVAVTVERAEADSFVRPQRRRLALVAAVAIGSILGGGLSASRSFARTSLRKDAEYSGALRTSEEKYRQLHESMMDCFAQTDMSGRVVLTNQPFRDLLGLSDDELRAKSYDELTPIRWRDLEKEVFEEVVSKGYSRIYQKELIKKDGSTVPVELRIFLLRDSAGAPVGMWAIVRDISEREREERRRIERAEELERRVLERTIQLAASNKRLEEFAYTVAHDLRAPLRSIDGFARILDEEYGPRLDDEGRRIIGVIRSSDRKMDGLIRDLLAVSSLAKSELNRTPLDMRELAAEALRSCADPEILKEFEFVVGDLPEVEADAPMMARVWTNLLSNAVKYSASSPRKRIEVSGSMVGEGVDRKAEFAVKDYGAGFDPAYKDKLFGLFHRLHSENEYSGSGIGLAIVKQIIERHGGSVRAEGTPGGGAVFGFSLPARSL